MNLKDFWDKIKTLLTKYGTLRTGTYVVGFKFSKF